MVCSWVCGVDVDRESKESSKRLWAVLSLPGPFGVGCCKLLSADSFPSFETGLRGLLA